jgi:putative transposase
VKSNQAKYRITTLCRTLGVSASGYHAWSNRPPSARQLANMLLADRIEALWRESRETYGRPRIQADLRDEGSRASDKRVARLMRERKIQGATRRKGFKTTVRDRDARPAPDLVERKFSATAPDQLWVADITYVPTWAGFLFLAVVLDVFSRRVVGWAMATHLRTELVLDALNMAIYRRRPKSVIHHSDQGCQYTSIAFGKRCGEASVRPSMGSVGDCYDNAMCESFNATLECELLVKRRFKNQREAALAVFDFIEGFYNPRRRHTAIGSISPMEFERRMSQAA